MKTAVVFLADGFEDIEALGTVDILRRAGIDVTIAGVTGMEVTSAHNIIVKADKSVKDISAGDYDAIVCPGGMPGATNLRDSDIVVDIVTKGYNQDKLIAAICAAPMVLDKAGVLAGKSFTMYPGMESHAPSGKYNSNELVIKDGNIITGAGPATTFKFALEIVKNLQSSETAEAIYQGMLIDRI